MKIKLIVITLLLMICTSTGFAQELVYSTYLGGSEEDGGINNWLKNISLDQSGTIYFASYTYSSDFPVTANAFDKKYNGGGDWGDEDLIIAQFNIEENDLKYSSYFGGKTGPEFVSSILLKNGSLYLTGNTGSTDLPVTNNAYDKTFNGPDFRHSDGYIARFSDNKLNYLTYIGTSGCDWINEIFVNDNGEMIVVGMINEWDELPVTSSFSKEKFDNSSEKIDKVGNACVIRFNSKGDSVLSITVLGPTWNLNAVRDNDGNIYIAGTTPSKDFPVTAGAYDTSYNGGEPSSGGDIFVTKLTPAADQILFSTFLGGTNDEGAPSVCIDKFNNIIVYGTTYSKDFPLTSDALDKSFDGNREIFISKLSADGKQLLYSSYIGGDEKDKSSEYPGNIVAAKNGDIYICGKTETDGFPVTPNAIQSKINGGKDIFISVFDESLTKLKFSTFFGGSSDEEAMIDVNSCGDIIGVGSTNSIDYTTTTGAYSKSLKGRNDIIIFKISLAEIK